MSVPDSLPQTVQVKRELSTAMTIAGLVLWVVVSYLPSAVGISFRPDEWYQQLAKPSFNPPNWIFGPVWMTLYGTMGVAAWQVWRTAGWQTARVALSLFLTQLAVNAMWSWLFFGIHSPFAALINITVLIVLVLLTIWQFSKHSAFAAGLLIPYLCWISFASVLNFWIWKLNS